MYPDFLGIGAQKSGTTWLHSNLRLHPQVWMPPLKEIHYLDHGNMSLARRLSSKANRAKKGRSYLWEQIRALPAGGRLSDLTWAARYCLLPRNDKWYGSLFPSIPGKITGEICPGYARLRGGEVERVHRLMPSAKIVYLIRNPIDRAWSYAAQYFNNRRKKDGFGSLQNVPHSVLRAFFDKDRTGHSDYLGALDSWSHYYDSTQMLVASFDELAADPRSLLKRILEFLDVDSGDESIPETVAENQFRGRGSEMPAEIRAYLANLHYEQLAQLHDKLHNSWTSLWLDAAQKALGVGGSATPPKQRIGIESS